MDLRVPILETKRLVVRELTMADLSDVNRVLNDAFGDDVPLAERERWLRWTVLGYDMFAQLEQPHYGERAIVLKDTGTLIGAVGIVAYIASFGHLAAFKSRSGPATAEVGLFWGIAPEQQRKGYATEAAGAMIDYLFNSLKLGRIIATTGSDNAASMAVMRKLGMTIEFGRESENPVRLVIGVLDNPSF